MRRGAEAEVHMGLLQTMSAYWGLASLVALTMDAVVCIAVVCILLQFQLCCMQVYRTLKSLGGKNLGCRKRTNPAVQRQKC